VTWVPTDDEHVKEFKAPRNVDYSHAGRPMRELLLNGVVDAAIGEIDVDAPEIKPLIPGARNAAFDYFRRTGIYPINHGVVIKNSLLRQAPWVVDELGRAFEAAKAVYLENLEDSGSISSWDKAAIANAKVVGDPVPFGIEKNRKALEAITQFALGQKMVPRKFSVEELFQPLQ
jgi:4,5-dihydroxyphthalate decarboxylase